jgi:hypothetical protein
MGKRYAPIFQREFSRRWLLETPSATVTERFSRGRFQKGMSVFPDQQ